MRHHRSLFHPAMAESIHHLLLDHLDIHGSISDTRQLILPGTATPATDAESQITILGALNSLLSREVSDLSSPEIIRSRAFLSIVDDPL
jgi:phenylalanyl-tRNA synthetase alpha chain